MIHNSLSIFLRHIWRYKTLHSINPLVIMEERRKRGKNPSKKFIDQYLYIVFLSGFFLVTVVTVILGVTSFGVFGGGTGGFKTRPHYVVPCSLELGMQPIPVWPPSHSNQPASVTLVGLKVCVTRPGSF